MKKIVCWHFVVLVSLCACTTNATIDKHSLKLDVKDARDINILIFNNGATLFGVGKTQAPFSKSFEIYAHDSLKIWVSFYHSGNHSVALAVDGKPVKPDSVHITETDSAYTSWRFLKIEPSMLTAK